MIYKALLLIPAVLQSCVSQTKLIVGTRKGLVEGIEVNNNATGAKFRAFLGIKYAHIKTRFQYAEPVEQWDGILPAVEDGAPCPQLNNLMENWNEECLFINVYTPLDAVPGGNLPVMVFIHGGGFTLFSSYSKMFGPDYIVPKDVILVTFNYRLGFAGFLTMGSKDAPGNMGLHDSSLALDWVQREITYFGGDKGKVTLWGHSGGSSITLFHYISTQSVGKFKRAIAQSGPITADWSSYTKTEAITRAKALAKAVNCDDTQPEGEIIRCLQAANITELVKHSLEPGSQDDSDIPGAGIPFMPILEDYQWATPPFFNKSLEKLAKEAKKRNIPLVTGITSDEGIYFIAKAKAGDAATTWTAANGLEPWKKAEDKAHLFLPKCMREKLKKASRLLNCGPTGCMRDGSAPRTEEDYAEKVKDHYFTNLNNETETIKSTIRLYGDNRFTFPFMTVARFFGKNTHAYLFTYYGTWRIPSPFYDDFHIKGVEHGGELPYLFFGLSPNQKDDKDHFLNNKVKDFMTEMWTNFAKTGDLRANGINNWPTVEQGEYLKIGEDFSVNSIDDLNKNYYEFWSALIAQSRATCALL